MPIKDLSESVRLPRLGKIRLGTKDPDRGFPRKSEFFVFPPGHSDYKKLVELYGEKPKELPILIPVEDEETWASQYYRSYNQTYGLVCKGDGETAMRMVSVETGELPDPKKAGTVTMKEIACDGRDCPIYQNKEKGKPQCHEVMNLRFILPEVPGLGVWQIDTGSKNSILNINSCAKIIKRVFGRISMIPLKLTFEPMEINQPDTGKKQTVYVLNLRTAVTMAQLADAAREQAKTFILEAPEFEVDIEKEIDELWGEKPVDVTTGEIKEPKVEKPKKIKQAPESQIKPPAESANGKQPEPEKPVETEAQEQECFVDLDWLKESLTTLHEKGIKAYSNANIVSYLGKLTGQQHKTVSDACKSLTREQAEETVQYIQDALEMA